MNEIEYIGSKTYATSRGTSITGSINAEIGDILIAHIVVRSELTIPDDMELLFTGSIAEADVSNQSLSMAFKKVTVSGSQSVTINQATSGRIYLNLIVVRNVKSINYTGNYKKILTDNLNKSPVSIVKESVNKKIIWGITCIVAKDSDSFSCTPNDIATISQNRLASFVDVSSNKKEHSIKYTLSESHTYLIDAVELIPFQSKYLISDGSNYYNVSSGALNKLEITELTADSFTSYGNDELPDGSLLLNLSNPSVMCWTDAEELPVINANVTATPKSQNVISNAIDLTHKSITGIESATVNCDGELIIAVSFDNKQTWKAWNGSEWSTLSEDFTGMNKETLESITFEQWNLLFTGASNFYIRVSLIDTTQSVTEIIVDFAN